MKGLDYFRVVSNIAFDDDLEHVSDAAFRTYIELIGIASFDLTDGRVTLERARKLCNTPDFHDAIAELSAKKYIKTGVTDLTIISYKKYQKSRREVRDLRDKGRERVTRYRRVTNAEGNALLPPQSKSSSKSKSIPPVVPPKDIDLVTLCREYVPDWKTDDRDEQTVALGVTRLGNDGMRQLILKLATRQAATGQYKDLRRTLGNWINTEKMPAPQGESPDDPGPQYEDVVIPPGAWKP